MSLIDISNLTFCYDNSYDNVFENVSFQINTDWKLGFIGRNGKGKTTFLKLLLGKYEYRGVISTGVCFEYFPYEVKDRQKNTIEVIKDIYPDHEYWKLIKELSLLNISEDVLYRRFSNLSNGEQAKILLAILFLKENRFLLIDEPANHLDFEARLLVSNYLSSKKGFILVSHDRTFLDNCIDHILSINNTSIEIQRGNFSTWITNKKNQDHFENSQNQKLKKDIKRLQKSASQSSEWADKVESTKIGKDSSGIKKSLDNRAYIGEKSRRMQQRRKNLERRKQAVIQEKSNLLKNIDSAESLKILQLQYHTQMLVSLKNVSVCYGEKVVSKDVSFTIEHGDRIALCGKNGSGKSSIMKLICGEDIEYTGSIYKGSGLKISYVSQDTSFLRGRLKEYALNCNIDESLFKAILRKLDFSRVQFEKDISNFSSGQKKKVLIAKSLCERAHLYVWDEPLNFIDVISRMQIEDLFITDKPTILFVEHDISFCNHISTKKITLSK